ncbi:MAG: ISKra4 family transposase, partial [Synergistaceae bacterium]|nr:ISKra4 family transposase [Synergistaceae bacterium]
HNAANIDYPAYIAKGYFIGSGAIESGNKLVLQQRLKQPGMRWNVETAQSLLTLRAKAESDLWEKNVLVPFTLSLRT